MGKKTSRSYRQRRKAKKPVPKDLKKEARIQKALGTDIGFRDNLIKDYFMEGDLGKYNRASGRRHFEGMTLSILYKLKELKYLVFNNFYGNYDRDVFNFIEKYPTCTAQGNVLDNHSEVNITGITFIGNPSKTFLIAILRLGSSTSVVSHITPRAGGYKISLSWANK